VSALWLLLLLGLAPAQDYRGDAVPVAERTDPIAFYRLRFLTFAFGHEGPMEMPLSTTPVTGHEYLVEADIFGIESVATLKFELVDVTGRPLQTLHLWKSSDGASDGEFYGFVTVPQQPFRVVATGTCLNGMTFRAPLNTLFQPLPSGPPEQPVLPTGIPAADTARLQAMVTAYRQEMRVRSDRSAVEHPDGLVTLGRPIVSKIGYEPFASSAGMPIGVRLRYSIRFPTRQTISAVPHVFPTYTAWEWRGMVTMKPLGGNITPAPVMIGAQTLQDVIVYGAAATFETGKTYNFSIDLIPDYVFQGAQTGRFCIHEQKFTNREAWNALIDNTSAIPYSISIADTQTSARIPSFYPQATFYQGFKATGAFDCGPVPNSRF
jgi:hypothetical protein